MKKLLKSVLVLTAISGMMFTSCKDDSSSSDSTTESKAPTLTVNNGATSGNASATLDTVNISVLASADTDRKIKKLTITRAVTGASTNTILSKTYDTKDVIYTHVDLLKENSVTIDDGNDITYSVTVEDDKGKTTNATYVIHIASMATSGQILLGGPTSTVNEYHFFGTSDNFRRYKAGSTGSDLAKDNSAKVDFIFFYNSAGSVMNAMYSPDYPFGSGQGWYTEVSTWPTKNSTSYYVSSVTSSQFDALQGSTFLDALASTDWSTGAQNKISNLGINEVYGFKKADGKRGFIKIGNIAADASGQILLVCKVEL